MKRPIYNQPELQEFLLNPLARPVFFTKQKKPGHVDTCRPKPVSNCMPERTGVAARPVLHPGHFMSFPPKGSDFSMIFRAKKRSSPCILRDFHWPWFSSKATIGSSWIILHRLTRPSKHSVGWAPRYKHV